MRSFLFADLVILLVFPLLSTGQEKQSTGNNLFELLDKAVTSNDVKKFDAFYNMEISDNSNRQQRSNGIEYNLKDGKIKRIILHKADNEWSSYSYELPLGLKWTMTENDVIGILGVKENSLPYHYDRNLDVDPKYDNEKRLYSIELKYTDYFAEDSKEKDDDALLALFLSDPTKFKYLKNTFDKNERKSNVFDKAEFKRELNDIIKLFADKKSEQLKGDFLFDTKSNSSITRHYASTQPVSHIVNQYLQQKEIATKLNYVLILDELKTAKAATFPASVLNKYNYWISIVKEVLTSPWTLEDAEVYEGILDRGVTFENKTGQTTSGGFTYYKYPFIDVYIVYKMDHYSIELNIY